METSVVAAPSPAETVRDPPACAGLAQGCQPPAARAGSPWAAARCWVPAVPLPALSFSWSCSRA